MGIKIPYVSPIFPNSIYLSKLLSFGLRKNPPILADGSFKLRLSCIESDSFGLEGYLVQNRGVVSSVIVLLDTILRRTDFDSGIY
jgi:hypothetical protein